jgi:hypothetical protein
MEQKPTFLKAIAKTKSNHPTLPSQNKDIWIPLDSILYLEAINGAEGAYPIKFNVKLKQSHDFDSISISLEKTKVTLL